MTLRTASPSDFETLTELWESSVRATHDFLLEEDLQALRPQVREVWLPALTIKVFVDEADHILGFMGISGGKLEMLFVSSSARGQGVGKALLAHAISLMSVRFVDVNEQNIQALGFYQRQGFEVFDRSPLDGQGRPYPLLHMRFVSSAITASGK